MKLTLNRPVFSDMLTAALPVVPSRTPKPVLMMVRLTAKCGQAFVAATDLEVSLMLSTDKVDITTEGETLLPADKLAQIVRQSEDATITIEADEKGAVVRTADGTFKLNTQPAADFPPVVQPAGETSFTIGASVLGKLIDGTEFAMARETTRYATNGIFFERDGKAITAAATDSHRLAVVKAECDSATKGKKSCILPAKAANLARRVYGDGAMVQVTVDDGRITFATDKAVLSSNLVEGQFPPYRDVIPRDGQARAAVKSDAFLSALRRAALLTNEESKGVRLEFAGQKLTITGRAAETGEATVTLPMDAYTGEPVTIGFNPQYLIDAVKACGDTVNIELQDHKRPGVFRSGAFLCVVMPVALA